MLGNFWYSGWASIKLSGDSFVLNDSLTAQHNLFQRHEFSKLPSLRCSSSKLKRSSTSFVSTFLQHVTIRHY
ncbi:hypothetical protein T4D_15763 [Trichinella pseudospiralis]|uniref:Uncharacterized protein n=1 Tax=Trichinella pseudospiralis TaxID=6337 RepID=A0A0V1FYP4_TRIPS|nr:hypothetical protein T4D_15763 [Trichinella pseudospiralis]